MTEFDGLDIDQSDGTNASGPDTPLFIPAARLRGRKLLPRESRAQNRDLFTLKPGISRALHEPVLIPLRPKRTNSVVGNGIY